VEIQRTSRPEPATALNNPQSTDLSHSVAGPRIRVEAPQSATEVSKRLFETEKEYRVAIAQISTHPGRIEQNTEKIIDRIMQARAAGARLVVFPELAIPGYHAMDLFYNESYVAANLKALQRVREASSGITVIVGFVEPALGAKAPGGRPRLYNSAAIIHDGKIVDVQQKSLIPTYGIFDESRYFTPAQERKVIEVGGIKIGTEICEDLWSEDYPIDPASELAKKGAELIVNLSSSPFHMGKLPVRAAEIRRASSDNDTPFVYANLVGGFDGYEGEVLYDGRSMVMTRSGKLSAMAAGFKEDLLVVDIHSPQELTFPKINEMEELHDALVMGIRDYFSRRSLVTGSEIPKAFIGLSGGVDSALVAALLVEALGPEKVVGITMPSKYSSSATISDAEILAKNLNIPCKVLPIGKEVEACLTSLREDPEFSEKGEDVTEENVQARLRTLNLMAYSNKLGGIMVNTGNKTELILNNCTIYGDMAGGFSVLGDVDKDRVYELSRYVNERAGKEIIPQATIDRIPTAELKPGQSDENVMGAHPAIIAPLAREIFERGLSVNQALSEFGDEFSEDLILRVFQRMDDFEFKSRQMPPALRVTSKAYGIGRRIPMNHGFYK